MKRPEARSAVNVRRNLARIGWLERVEDIVARYPVAMDDVLGTTHSQAAATARQAAWHALREAGLSYPEIGSVWDRHHTTVMSGVRRHVRGQKR